MEVGAGTGYWANCLRLSCPGLGILAYDKTPPPPPPVLGGDLIRAAAGLVGGKEKAAKGAGMAMGGGKANEYHGKLPA